MKWHVMVAKEDSLEETLNRAEKWDWKLHQILPAAILGQTSYYTVVWKEFPAAQEAAKTLGA